MRRLLLPFFITRLLISLLPFLLVTATTLLSPFRSFLITLLFFIYFSLLLFKSLTQKPISPVTVPNAQIETEITKWLSLYHQQPTHRDVLINLSLLYSAQGDTENARQYLNQAREIDPNHPLVKNVRVN